jgi:mRNA interferase RelE/StbE
LKVKNYLKGYRIYFTNQAKRDIKKLEKADAKDILEKLEDLVEGKENLDVTPLEGSSTPLYRLRVGNYRVIYEVWKHTITVAVIEIGHRKEVYRKR